MKVKAIRLRALGGRLDWWSLDDNEEFDIFATKEEAENALKKYKK